MNFEFDNNLPIYVQLVEQLKIFIISGRYQVGEKIPSVRELASKAKVNPNTMQKALQELESLKLIYTERTTGKYITTDKKVIENLKNEYAKNLTNKYFENMTTIGYSKEQTINYLQKLGGNNGTIKM